VPGGGGGGNPPSFEQDDYARVYGPPHIRELGYWGVGVSVVSALFTSSGLCLQKVVYKRIAEDPEQGPAYKHSLYIAGVAYVTVGLFLKGVIDVLLPQSAIAPLSAQTVLYSSLLEYMFLEGEMTRLTGVALCIISIGIVIASFGSNTVDGEYSLHDLWEHFMRKTSIIVSASLVAALITFREILRNSSGGLTGTRGLMYMAAAAGLFAGWFGTATKSTFEVIKYAFLHGMHSDDARHSGVWILVCSLPLLGIPKLRIVGSALMEFHHLQFLPLYQSAAIAANAMCGIVYFNDFGYSRIEGTHVSPPLYLVGLGMVCTGILLLAHRYNPAKHLIAFENEESSSLLGWSSTGDLEKDDPESASMLRYKDEFGSRGGDARTPNKVRVVVRGSTPSPLRPNEKVTGSGGGVRIPQRKYSSSNLAANGSNSNSNSSGNLAGMSTPSKRDRDREGGGGELTPSSYSISTPPHSHSRGRVASTPSRSNSSPNGAARASPGPNGGASPSFSGVARKGYGIDEALALAQMQGRGHRRAHSGQYDATFREIVSPYENNNTSGEQLQQQATPGRNGSSSLTAAAGIKSPVQMQALYVGSMEGLVHDDDDEEVKEGR